VQHARQQERRGKIGGGGCERQDADCNCFGWELEMRLRGREIRDWFLVQTSNLREEELLYVGGLVNEIEL
jgi:hypothetical protein